MNPRASQSFAPAAFTLIEMVISAALMSLILVSAYLCLNAGFSSQKVIEPRSDAIQQARVALSLITADLRAACVLDRSSQFIGMQRTLGEMEADNLDFATHHYAPRQPREADYCQESLYVDQNPATGQFSLYRRRNPTLAPDPLVGGSKEEIVTGIRGLRFEYTDGEDWYDNWGETKPGKRETSQREQPNLYGLPHAVRVTLWIAPNAKSKPRREAIAESEEPPLAFQTVVCLDLAAALNGSANDSTVGNSGGHDGAMPGGGF